MPEEIDDYSMNQTRPVGYDPSATHEFAHSEISTYCWRCGLPYRNKENTHGV